MARCAALYFRKKRSHPRPCRRPWRLATGYALSLNFALHPWLAQIVLRLLWRPASQRYARRSSAHTDSEPLLRSVGRRAGCFVERSKAQRSEPIIAFAGRVTILVAEATPTGGLLRLHRLAFDFCPAVSKRHDAVNYRSIRRMFCGIRAEITQPFELNGLTICQRL